ncbi:hypothetical protein V5O48_000650 [Marasmius crinis-equi]|uniref:Rab-GAP TBC domain-containing protein n=1 Tax=Marasmius crinis-equi TaxID=585013 RepID=A0ABR3G1C0_9AGAR
MDAVELSRWTRFAAKGGIGKCSAIQDCVAEGEQDLMFLKDDEITVLMQIPDIDGVYLGYCEGVVGRFNRSDVHFHSKLKKPVMTKRSSVVQAKSPTPSLISPATPSPAIPPSPSRSSYTPLLPKSPSPISSSSSSPPPVLLYPISSKRTSSARSSSGPLTRNTYTTDEEPLEKGPSAKSGASIPVLPSQSVQQVSRKLSDPSYPGNQPRSSSVSSGSLSSPPVHISTPSPSHVPSSSSSALSSSSMFGAEVTPEVSPPPLARSTSKPRSLLNRMNSIDSTMNASDVPDEWVKQEVGALLAEKVKEEEASEGAQGSHSRNFTSGNVRASQASSRLGYGSSDDEAINVGNDEARLSTASYATDDGQVGIGLSLMGALAASDSDSDEEVDLLGRSKATVRAGISFDSDDDDEDRTVEGGVQSSPQRTENAHTPAQSLQAQTSRASDTGPEPAPVKVPPRSDSLRFNKINTSVPIKKPDTTSPSAQSLSSFSDPHSSPHPFDGYPSEGEEWEGASDIYDNYRYSRYSRYSRFSVANSQRFSGVSVNSTKGHRQIPSTSTMPPWQGGVVGSPTSSSFSPGATKSPESPSVNSSTDVGLLEALKKEELERYDSPVDPGVPSTSTPTSFADVPTPPAAGPARLGIGMFGGLGGGIMISTSTTTVVEEVSEPSIQDANPSPIHLRSLSVASTVESDYSHDSEANRSADIRQRQSFELSSPARGYVTADGEESPFPSTPAMRNYLDSPTSASSNEPAFRPSHLSMLEAHAASFLRPENATLWQTTGKLNINKSPSPARESFDIGPAETSRAANNAGAGDEESITVVGPDNQVESTTSDALPSSNEPPPASSEQQRTPPRAREPKGRPTPLTLLSTTSVELTGSSPLLHTRWGSPVSSTGMSSGSAYDESASANSLRFSESGSVGMMSPTRESNDRPPLTPGGMASVLRERLETEKPKGSYTSAIAFSKDRHSGMPLVVEDDEELPSHARNHDSKDFEADTTLDTEGGEKDMSLVSDTTYTRRILDGLREDSFEGTSNTTTGLSALGKLVTSADDTAKESRSHTPSPTTLIVQASSPTTPSSVYHEPASPSVSSHSAGPPSPSPSAFPIPPTHQGDLVPSNTTVLPSNPAHLRPQAVGDGERKSLFLPHPNAPKPPSTGPGLGPMGPLYQGGNSPQQQQTFNTTPYRIDPKKIAIHALRLALSAPPPPASLLPPPSSAPIRGKNGKPAPTPPPPPRPRGPTIYARVDVDLSSASGPVPITFGIEPMGPPPLPGPPPLHDSHNRTVTSSPQIVAPAPRVVPSPLRMGSPAQPEILRQTSAMKDIGLSAPLSPIAPPSPLKDVPFFDQNGRFSPQVNRSNDSSPQNPSLAARKGGEGMLGRSATASAALPSATPASLIPGRGPAVGNSELFVPPRAPVRSSSEGETAPPPNLHTAAPEVTIHAPIPRANFTPQVGGLGMRPRSRSFSAFNSPPVGNMSSRIRDDLTFGRPRAQSNTGSEAKTPPTLTKSTSTPKLHVPSPLSIQTNNTSGPAGGIKPPHSPLASSPTMASPVPPSPTKPTSPVSPTKLNGSRLRKVTSVASLQSQSSSYSTAAESSPPSSPIIARRMSSKHSFQSMDGAAVATIAGSSLDMPPVPTGVGTPVGGASDSDTTSLVSGRSQVVSPQPFDQRNSLRSKLSLPNMRRSSGRGSLRQDSIGSMSRTVLESGETVQVQDMDFELVKPNVPFQSINGRSSEDSSVLRPGSVDQLRAESPAMSIASAGSRMATGLSTDSAAMRARANTKTSETEATMESHRQRELKWVQIMSSVPPPQARKNKKVRKLIGEGVPSSVRYLVWSHLTDCKAKNVPGVYASFGKRARVAAFREIEADVQRCFTEHAHLQTTQGPVTALLQAYLTMVPDVPYTAGLTLIAGHLLLLAPEEDAFWIFVSMMDPVLRPYFSPASTQMEVDAALFSRALEVNDPQTAKKLLMDMSINPAHICSPWFSTLFVGSLPAEYTNRVWDFFLFEGVPFLIRVGLAIVYCCRRALLDATSEEMVLRYLRHLSPNWLPPSADAFITLALSFKVKDDDIRKQRIKMEAQVKRQAQQAPRAAGGAISLPRS